MLPFHRIHTWMDRNFLETLLATKNGCRISHYKVKPLTCDLKLPSRSRARNFSKSPETFLRMVISPNVTSSGGWRGGVFANPFTKKSLYYLAGYKTWNMSKLILIKILVLFLLCWGKTSYLFHLLLRWNFAIVCCVPYNSLPLQYVRSYFWGLSATSV